MLASENELKKIRCETMSIKINLGFKYHFLISGNNSGEKGALLSHILNRKEDGI